VTTALTLLLATMAAVNLLFVTRANVVGARRMLAIARALGVTPVQATAALAVGQLFPALAGLVTGGAVGAALFNTLSTSSTAPPPATQLLVLAVVTVGLTAALSAIPARLEARRPIAQTLRTG
jgi:putative ABC transport system permease protein